VGLQFLPTAPEANLLVFEHECGSSISIFARRLRHLLPEAPPEKRRIRECPGRCLMIKDLEICNAPCSAARDRQLVRLILRAKRQIAAGELADLSR
jgi:hypothetical protein